MEQEEIDALAKSPRYQDRFRAEYHQLKKRYERLKEVLDQTDEERGFQLKSPRYMLEAQAAAMEKYLDALRQRSYIEDTDL